MRYTNFHIPHGANVISRSDRAAVIMKQYSHSKALLFLLMGTDCGMMEFYRRKVTPHTLSKHAPAYVNIVARLAELEAESWRYGAFNSMTNRWGLKLIDPNSSQDLRAWSQKSKGGNITWIVQSSIQG